MPYVIRIVGIEGVVVNESAAQMVGAYVAGADVDAEGGVGTVFGTQHLDRALHFESVEEATTAWRKQSTVRPFRDDGQPNRPMTAFSVEILSAPAVFRE